jgi:hypothetical protein
VPDLAFAIALYARGERDRMPKGYFLVEDKEIPFSQHRHMCDFQGPKELLESSGFEIVQTCALQERQTPDIEMLRQQT